MATAKMPLQTINAAGPDVSSQYKRVTQRDHILLRPDTYIGSIEQHTDTMLVHDGSAFALKKITYVPGLFKIFDEILVNAADNKQRDRSMDSIKVTINPQSNTISVYNTGKGIPVQIHSKEKIYIPELIFGNLLTGANFNDDDKKVVGGRNGYGAKLCNIFSTKFTIETCDTERGLRYKQVFEDNMSVTHKPDITKASSDDRDFTCVTFTPDLGRFHMSELSQDVVQLLTRRVYDVAGSTQGVRVFFNGQRVPIKCFKDYVDLVTKDLNIETPIVYEKVNERWEVGMTISKDNFQQVSFVNSIATTKGGTHVNYIADQVVSALDKIVQRKNKGAPIKAPQIKQHMWLFINCLVENPSFDSQTKENLTRKAKDFGSTCELSAKFLKDVSKSGIVDMILDFARHKSDILMLKSHKGTKRAKLKGIPKLEDANDAGTRNAHTCTLILTEGDSAKALAISGLSVVGRDRYGVFPLRGKLLNVREASHHQIMENAEIKAITQIMGLQHGVEYTDVKQLRYGRLMIMADQDQDGSHIKGLVINFIHHFWPSLLKLNDFLVEFITPIVKCTKGKTEKCFFTLPQYQAWVEEQGNMKGWRIKYYKGLGTSTPQEAKEYFSRMDEHQKQFKYEGQPDFDAIEMAFSKKHVEARKEWLSNFVPGTFLDHSQEHITYNDFINKELILFSMADNARSIPSIMDGFKPGQRKVLFACFKRNLTTEIKVAQLAGYVAEHSSYHHGENSLAATIVNMAQNYVGSNNVNLLLPIGQFGTRLAGGKDAASTRYIFTSLSPLARKIFSINDDDLLSYLDDDGQSIEPEWYAPILPMVLVNGSDGIGTGWSSFVPNFNPREIAQNLMRLIDNQPTEAMSPWYRGFTGSITPSKGDKYTIRGRIEKTSDTTVEITELPIGTWTQTYKEMLEVMAGGGEKNEAPVISDYSQHHTDTTVHFVVTMTAEQMAAAEAKGLEKFFKLESSMSTSNMVLFDASGRLKRYESPDAILRDFYETRVRLYQRRKTLLADRLQETYERLDNKVRFIKAIISGTLVINNRKRDIILKDLVAQGFKGFPKKAGRHDVKTAEEEAEAEEEAANSEATGKIVASDYDYLLSMPLWSLTMEKVNKLQEERAETEATLSTLLAKSPEQLWREDLEEFMTALTLQEEAEAEAEKMAPKKGKGGRGKAAKAKASRKKVYSGDSDEDDDDDFIDDDDEEDDWMPTKPKASKKTTSATVAAATAAAPSAAVAKKPAAKTSKASMSTLAPAPVSVSAPAPAVVSTSHSLAAARKPAVKHTISAPSSPEADRDGGEPVAPAARARRQASKTISYAMDDSVDEPDLLLDEDDGDDFQPSATSKAFDLKGTSTVVSGNAPKPAAVAKKATAAPSAGARKAKKLARPAADSDDDDDDFLNDDFGASEDDDDDDDEDFEAPKAKGKGSKKAAAKPKPTKMSKKEMTAEPKAAVVSAPVAAVSAPAAKPAKTTKAPKAAAATSKPAAAAKPAKKAAGKAKAKKATSDDDDEFALDDEMEFDKENKVAVTPAVKNRSRRQVNRVKYTFDDDEDEEDDVPTYKEDDEDEDDFTLDQDDDDSDFE